MASRLRAGVVLTCGEKPSTEGRGAGQRLQTDFARGHAAQPDTVNSEEEDSREIEATWLEARERHLGQAAAYSFAPAGAPASSSPAAASAAKRKPGSKRKAAQATCLAPARVRAGCGRCGANPNSLDLQFEGRQQHRRPLTLARFSTAKQPNTPSVTSNTPSITSNTPSIVC